MPDAFRYNDSIHSHISSEVYNMDMLVWLLALEKKVRLPFRLSLIAVAKK
ncbi:MAG: hypothetical protein HY644_10490 [Acidobacteria bacterium]|nr:hypothetical protein [Acidobacteriota bacterium]